MATTGSARAARPRRADGNLPKRQSKRAAEGRQERLDHGKAALSRKVVATVNGKKIKMSVADIAYRRLGDKAMSGDQKALAFLLTLADDGNPADVKINESTTSVQQDLEIIADYFQRHQKGKEP